MTNSWLLSVLVVFSLPALAKPSLCYERMMNKASAHPANPEEVQQAQFWLRANGADEGYPKQWDLNPQYLAFLNSNSKDIAMMDPEERQEWAGRYMLSKWGGWKSANTQQRQQALTLEMMKISPKDPNNNVTPLTPDIKTISSSNKERMLAQLRATYSTSAEAQSDPSLKDIAKQLSREIRFIYVRPIHLTQFAPAPDNFAGPIVSPRDLAPYGLDYASGLYSDMVGNSPSAEFMVTGLSVVRDVPNSIGNLLRRESAILKPRAAKQLGFGIPRFASVAALFDFFEFWDPQACEETFRVNWKSLPRDVHNYAEFRAYVEMHSDEMNFEKEAYARLAPFRTRLNQYIMTTVDLEDFLSQAIDLWVMHLGSHDPTGSLSQIRMDVDTSGKTLYVFRERVLPFLHMEDGLSLRVPVSVASADYTLARVDGMMEAQKRTAAAARPESTRPVSIRSGNVDHDSKP